MDVILERLSGDGSLTVADIAEAVGASTATIRRDLEHLAQQGLLSRTHGGAVSQGVMYELPLQYKSDRQKAEKRRIASAAAALVSDGDAVGLTGGTTTLEVARALVGRQNLTVVTNALNIASEVAVRPSVKLLVTGGFARSESYELVGSFAEETLSRIYLDIAFTGVDGISADCGLTSHHEVEAHTNRVLIERARRVVVVADSSKIGRSTFAQICALNRVGELITDAAADDNLVGRLRDAGVNVSTV